MSTKRDKTKHKKHSKKHSKGKDKSASASKYKQSLQLTNPRDFDPDRVIFSNPEKQDIDNGGKQKLTAYRINLSYRYPDGTVGPVLLEGNRNYSYGVTENTSKETGKVTGHSLCVNLVSRDGATPEEKDYIKAGKQLYDAGLNHVVKVKKKIKKPHVTADTLDGRRGGIFTCPLYFKRDEEGDIVEDGPVRIYPKLIEAVKGGRRILSRFYHEETEETVDPLSLKDRHFWITHCIKWESIWVGSKITYQLKLWEGYVRPTEGGMKRLLARPKVSAAKSDATPAELMGGDDEEKTEDADDGDEVANDVEEEDDDDDSDDDSELEIE